MRIIQEAKTPGEGAKVGAQASAGDDDHDDLEGDIESEVDVSGDYLPWLYKSDGKGFVFETCSVLNQQ